MRVDRIIIALSVILSLMSVCLTRKYPKWSDRCLIAAHVLVAVLCYLMWG